MSSVQTLQYADLPARWGVSCERTPCAFRIAVEPSGWRSITAGYVVAIAVLLFCSGMPLVTGLRTGDMEWPAIIAGGIVYLLPALIIISFLWQRFRQRVLFVVTAGTFTHAAFGASRRGRVTSLPRAEIGYVKLNPYNGQLTVQHVGKDLLDFYVSPNRVVVEFVADQLSHAIAHPPTARAEQTLPPQRPVSQWRRPVALIASLVLFVVALLLLFVVDGVIVKPIGAYMVLFASVPIGIAFGTQPKKFWV